MLEDKKCAMQYLRHKLGYVCNFVQRLPGNVVPFTKEGRQEGCKRFATVRGSVLPFGIQTQHTGSSFWNSNHTIEASRHSKEASRHSIDEVGGFAPLHRERLEF